MHRLAVGFMLAGARSRVGGADAPRTASAFHLEQGTFQALNDVENGTLREIS